jgi:hypothetical protein
MARIKIKDLAKDIKISKEMMRKMHGGGSGGQVFCKTPSGGFIPVIYTNIGTSDSDSDSDSENSGTDDISKSAGDESGTLDGLASGKIMSPRSF